MKSEASGSTQSIKKIATASAWHFLFQRPSRFLKVFLLFCQSVVFLMDLLLQKKKGKKKEQKKKKKIEEKKIPSA